MAKTTFAINGTSFNFGYIATSSGKDIPEGDARWSTRRPLAATTAGVAVPTPLDCGDPVVLIWVLAVKWDIVHSLPEVCSP